MATTTNYGWTTPDNTAYVKDGASAIRTLGSSIDTTVASLGQGVKSYKVDTAATLTLTSTTETSFFSAPSFTPVASRLYEITVTIGQLTKTTAAGNMTIRLRKDSVSGTVLSTGNFVVVTVGMGYPYTKTIVGTLGSTAFVPTVTVQANTNGMTAANTTFDGSIIIKDIGPA